MTLCLLAKPLAAVTMAEPTLLTTIASEGLLFIFFLERYDIMRRERCCCLLFSILFDVKGLRARGRANKRDWFESSLEGHSWWLYVGNAHKRVESARYPDDSWKEKNEARARDLSSLVSAMSLLHRIRSFFFDLEHGGRSE